jgi:hypothetical protein
VRRELFEIDGLSDEKFDVFNSPFTSSTIYNLGVKIKSFTSNFEYCINSKRKIETNFARNELLMTDVRAKDLYAKIREIETLKVVNKSTFSDEECYKLLRLVSKKKVNFSEVKYKAVIPSIGKRYSFDDLKNREIIFGDNDIWSKDCISQGKIVISNEVKDDLLDIINEYVLSIKISEVKPIELSRRGYHKDFEVENLSRNKIYGYIPQELSERLFFDLPDEFDKKEVYLGNSDISIMWGGFYKTYIDKQMIEEFTSLEEAVINLWHVLCYSNSIDEEDFRVSYEEYNSNEVGSYRCDYFYKRFNFLTKYTIKGLNMFLKDVSLKDLKEKYFGI